MKEEIVDTLRHGKTIFKLPVLYYESIEEGDTAAGMVGAMLREANLNMDYRGARADGRELLVAIVEELTGVPQNTKDTGERDTQGNPILEVDEKDSKYVERALTLKPEVTDEQVQSLLTSRARGYTDAKGNVIPAIAVDAKQKERKSRLPVRLAKKFLDAAEQAITTNVVDSILATACAKWNVAMPSPLVTTGVITVDAAAKVKYTEALGWAIKAVYAAKEANPLANL